MSLVDAPAICCYCGDYIDGRGSEEWVITDNDTGVSAHFVCVRVALFDYLITGDASPIPTLGFDPCSDSTNGRPMFSRPGRPFVDTQWQT